MAKKNNKKICIALTKCGNKCRSYVSIGDFCMNHYLQIKGIKNKRYNG